MERSQGRHTNRGYLVALAASAILSTTGLFIRHLSEAYQVPALVLAFWRNLFVVLALLPALALLAPDRLRMRRSDRSFLVLFGLVLAVFNGLWTISVALTGAAIATVLVYSSAAFSAILGWWVLGEELDGAKTVAVVMAIAGCVLISGVTLGGVGHAWGAGVGAGILSGLMYSVYGLMGRSASHRGLEPWSTLLYTFGVGTVFLLLPNLMPGGLVPGAAAVPSELLWLGNRWTGWGFLIALAAGPTLMGYGLLSVSLTHLPSSVTMLILTTEPPITVVLAYLLLGERLSASEIWGSLLILGAVALIRVRAISTPGRGCRELAREEPRVATHPDELEVFGACPVSMEVLPPPSRQRLRTKP